MTIVQDYTSGLFRCLQELSKQNVEEIAEIVTDAWRKGKWAFIMGNGGSASTASHFARDLQIGTAVEGKPRVKAISLTSNEALVTALANDIDYSSIFKEQLVGRLDEGDVVIGISASGNSPNILKAMEYARLNKAVTIGFLGFGGGKLKELVDKAIIVSSSDYGQVEDVHSSLGHIISFLVRERIAHGQ
jgi:D-sedoheptulose 7-phosphate isomerase